MLQSTVVDTARMGSSEMKVTGPGGVSAPSGSRAPKSAQGGATFAPITTGAGGEIARPQAASGLATVSSLEALMAMQDVGGPLERKRRAVARGGRLLDALDRLKIDMLDGELSQSAVESLAREAREQRQGTDDPGLDALLAQIETRAAVELAKLDMSRAAA
jgi:hypothetical protein